MTEHTHQPGRAIRGPRARWRTLASLGGALVMASTATALAAEPKGVGTLTLLGAATFPTGHTFKETELGGLSGIEYDAANDLYYLLSDDRSQKGAARFYTATITLAEGATPQVEFTDVVTLQQPDGSAFPERTADPEAIRMRDGVLYWTSEGDATNLYPPSLRTMTTEGAFGRNYPLPPAHLPFDAEFGPRQNLSFESLTLTPSGDHIWIANENALLQDGPRASLETGSPLRFVRIRRGSGIVDAEAVYITEPIAAAPEPADAFATNGLVEILAVGEERFITVERSFSVGKGNVIRLFLADASAATNLAGAPTIRGTIYEPMRKDLLLDLSTLGLTLDNIEGITFGPDLPSGERTLVLVSDNNFNANGQFTQFLAFKVEAN